MSFIYLDNNATTPLLSEVADTMHEIMGFPYGILQALIQLVKVQES